MTIRKKRADQRERYRIKTQSRLIGGQEGTSRASKRNTEGGKRKRPRGREMMWEEGRLQGTRKKILKLKTIDR